MRRDFRAAAALGVLVFASGSCPPVKCIQGRVLEDAIRLLVSKPWTDVDEAAVQAMCPHDTRMRIQPWEELGALEAWGETLERCCASCEECFFPGFWPAMGRSGEGLWRVTGYTCPLGREEAVRRVHRLVEAFGPPAGAKVYESPALRPTFFGYRWDSPAGRLQLDIRVWCELEECRVFTEAYRCEPPDVLEGVDLEAHPDARIFEINHYVDDPTMIDDLFVEIYSDCFHADGCCKEAEAKRFWPLLEREAEARGVTTVFTSVVDCSDNWSGPTFSKQEDGAWEQTNSECEPSQCRADEPVE